jgi:transposase InsO family protein
MPPRIAASEEALFRYLVVSAVLVRIGQGTRQADAVAEVAATPFPTLDGDVREATRRTIYRWLAAWRTAGIAGLEPAPREATEASRALSARLVSFLVAEKTADARASVPELIRRARLQEGLLDPDEAVGRVTVWRVLRRTGVPTRRQKQPHGGDTRSFEYPHRMQMILCDGKHFRAGKTRAKRVALFFLDDASRMGLHVVVGTAESAALFLRGLYEMIRRHGLFDIAYLDRGPGFIALDTAAVLQQLGALLILGVAGYPPGRGKVEKFNQTALNGVLRTLDGNAEVDADCGALALRIGHWLRETYNHTAHESLGTDVTPWQRWCADARDLRLPEDDAELRGHFVLRETRKATKDHLVPWEGQDLELPKGLASQQIELHHQVLDDTVSVLHEGRFVRLHPVDRHANALSRRGRPSAPEEIPSTPPRPSAAELAFRRDLRPLVGPDGGFSDPEPGPDGPDEEVP